MTVTTQLSGRLGNNFYQVAACIAYALQQGMAYHIPAHSPHMPGGINHITVTNTADAPEHAITISEPVLHKDGRVAGIYKPWAADNRSVVLKGYWQSFRYFDKYRAEVLKALEIPYRFIKDVVSIHVRRGDYLQLPAFEVLPMLYYENCIQYFKVRGYDTFYIFSDDIEWCKEQFTSRFGCAFIFVEGGNELGDFSYMSCCEHNIVANSSYSFAAAWLNQNPDKIVLCPDTSYCWFNDEYIPDYYTVMPC